MILPPAVRGFFSRIDARLPVVCALPVVQVLVNRQWIYSCGGCIDPWVYFGYFNDFGEHLRTYPFLYYSARLSWLVPGAIAYRLFSPVVANYVLHLALCEVALVSLYLTLAWTTRRDIAFLATTAMAGYPFFLVAMGWDYVDGAGIAYYLLAMCLATYATRSRFGSVWTALAGAAYAAAIHSHVIWLPFTPIVVGYCLIRLEHHTVRAVAAAIVSFAAGMLALTAILAGINAWFTGDWLFFSLSLKIAGELTDQNPWKVTGYRWVVHAPALALPSVALAMVIWSIQRFARGKTTGDRTSLFFIVQYVLFVLAFIALEIKGLPLLETEYYVSYLIPVIALAFGGVLYASGPRRLAANPVLVGVAAVAMATLPYTATAQVRAARVTPAYHIGWPALGILIGAAALPVGTTTGTVVFLAALGSANTLMQNPGMFPERDSGDNHFVFRAVADTLPLIQSCATTGDARFWYNATDRYGHVYISIASTQMWSWRLIGDTFPSLNPVAPRNAVADVGDRVVITSDDADRWPAARAALAPFGLSVERLWSRSVAAGPVRFEVTCVQLGRVHGDDESVTSVPVEQFARPDARIAASAVAIDPLQHALKVTTSHSTFEQQVRSDSLPLNGFGDYWLEFTMAVEQGGMGVSIEDDQSVLLASKYWCMRRSEREAGVRFRRQSGSSARIFLHNCAFSSRRASRFSVKNVRISHSSN